LNARSRQEAILRSLRRNGSTSVAALAAEVGTSRRTILRDVGALRDEGFVIHGEGGRGGGLQLDPRSVQTAARLSSVEVFALLISVAAMRAAGSLPFGALADGGLAKIERALPAEKVKDLRSLLDCLYIGRLSPLQDISGVGSIDDGLLPAFETAFLRGVHLRFLYCDARGVETRREVEPQALLILPPLWYIVAWDPDRSDFRHFRMDRISQPDPVDGRPFRRRHVPFEDDVCPYEARGRRQGRNGEIEGYRGLKTAL
jgi:predicted DNA-binding transcriptional regulator YafY